MGEPHAHQPRARRPHPARLADAALDLRHADAGAGLGQHAGVQRERPVDLRGGRAVQHRHRVQAVLSNVDSRLLERAARPQPACRAAGQQLLQALHARHHARRPRHHHDDARLDGAVHRARGARHDEPRHLRHRGAVRSCKAVDGTRAAGAVERQGGLHVRGVHRAAAPAVPHRAELGRRPGAVTRLHGGGQQPHRLALQLQPHARGRDDDDDEGAHRRRLRRGRVRHGQRLLWRVDPAEHRCVDLPRPARRHPAELRLPRLDHHRPRGHRLRAAGELLRECGLAGAAGRPHASADQREEDGDQRPPRPAGLPVVEQLVRLQRQAGQLRAHARDRPEHGRHGGGGRAAQQLPAAGRARLRPGDQPERHSLRRRRPVHRGVGHDRRHDRRGACVRARRSTTSACSTG